MKHAAIFPAAFALAFATTDLQARHYISDAPLLSKGSSTLNCWPLDEQFHSEWYPTVSTLAEEPTPTLFSEAESRFDAENREIAISSRVRPAEKDPFALHASLPPRGSDVQCIEPFRLRRFDALRSESRDSVITPVSLAVNRNQILPPAISSQSSAELIFEAPQLQLTSAPLVAVAPSTQRVECDSIVYIMLWPEIEIAVYAEQEVQIISSGFSAEYGDCLHGPVNTCHGECDCCRKQEEIAQPKQSDEEEHTPASITEPAPTAEPTLE